MDEEVSHDHRISIHAPARGATFLVYNVYEDPVYFNPRSREGSDSGALSLLPPVPDFNPRSREGSDISGCLLHI